MANTMARITARAFALFILISVLTKADNNDHESNVISLDAKSFKDALNKNRNFVMFYAPWCGHCKHLSPTWDELSKLHNGDPVVIAKVDCTIETELCAHHEIVGFPTLKLFDVGGENHNRYTGKRDIDALQRFIQKHVDGEGGQTVPNQDAKPEIPIPKSNMVTLDDKNFEGTVAEGMFFIKFYAPWCGHCKKLAPIWEDLANSFSDSFDIFIAKVDCTQNPAVCGEQKIKGYPTLIWFKDGEQTDQYQGARTHEALKNYIVDKMDETLKETPEEQKTIQLDEGPEFVKGEVAELTVDNFDSHLSGNLVFVKFYAPWCGHCKSLAPTWVELAKNVFSESISIAKVDCTQHKTVCKKHQVTGYPTLKIFRNGELIESYSGPRNVEYLHAFIKRHLLRDEL